MDYVALGQAISVTIVLLIMAVGGIILAPMIPYGDIIFGTILFAFVLVYMLYHVFRDQ